MIFYGFTMYMKDKEIEDNDRGCGIKIIIDANKMKVFIDVDLHPKL